MKFTSFKLFEHIWPYGKVKTKVRTQMKFPFWDLLVSLYTLSSSKLHTNNYMTRLCALLSFNWCLLLNIQLSVVKSKSCSWILRNVIINFSFHLHYELQNSNLILLKQPPFQLTRPLVRFLIIFWSHYKEKKMDLHFFFKDKYIEYIQAS